MSQAARHSQGVPAADSWPQASRSSRAASTTNAEPWSEYESRGGRWLRLCPQARTRSRKLGTGNTRPHPALSPSLRDLPRSPSLRPVGVYAFNPEMCVGTVVVHGTKRVEVGFRCLLTPRLWFPQCQGRGGWPLHFISEVPACCNQSTPRVIVEQAKSASSLLF